MTGRWIEEKYETWNLTHRPHFTIEKRNGMIHISIRDSHIQQCGIAGGGSSGGENVNLPGSRGLRFDNLAPSQSLAADVLMEFVELYSSEAYLNLCVYKQEDLLYLS